MKIRTISVSEVNNYVKKVLDKDFILNNLSVKGEISNLKYHSTGHVYFSLKDKTSKINCVMFKSNAQNMNFIMEDGMSVVVTGRLSVYTVNGTFQIYCEEIEKAGLGDLYVKFEALKQKLNEEGYFDSYHKKSLPDNPCKIGVVTSPTGAAIQDIKNVIRRRNKFVDILLYPAQVQGEGAYLTIIEGIEYFNATNSVDVIIIGRGGGSIEELWAFNEEELAMAIFNSKIPIISAVGHEVDFTISDFVSDVRAATPSQAGELVVSEDILLYDKIKRYNEMLEGYIKSKFDSERTKLESFEKILSLNSPMNKIVNSYLDVEKLKNRLDFIMDSKFKSEKTRIISLNNVLQAHNPINVLAKGYAIIEGENGEVYSRKDDFKDEQFININLRDGSVKGTFTRK